MKLQSTRSENFVTDTAAVVNGLAPDGGLYVDPGISERFFDAEGCVKDTPYGIAARLLGALLPGFDDPQKIISDAYSERFSAPDITPVVYAGDYAVCELFHGPTSAFKDVALSVLPLLMTKARAAEGIDGRTVILTATSGDTGKAALEGFRDVPGTGITVFYPDEGVSAIQKLQMTSQLGGNVNVCAVRGDFDDCQSGVKNAFSALQNDDRLRSAGIGLSSANSINIGRLVPQVAYYFITYSKMMASGRLKYGDALNFVVPTGNFGDILAGYLAKQMGLPVGKLICASNRNNVLTDFLNTGVYDRRRPLYKTQSPSMDILVSSNLERLLFYKSGCDSNMVSRLMNDLSVSGRYEIGAEMLGSISDDFEGDFCDEQHTLDVIGRVWNEYGYLCDTHTAVAFGAAENFRKRYGDLPVAVLSTASPYKFSDAVLRGIGEIPGDDVFANMQRLSEISGIPVPSNLGGLKDMKVRFTDVIDRDGITDYVLDKLLG